MLQAASLQGWLALTNLATKVGYASDDRIIGIALDNYFSGKEQCREKPVGALFLSSYVLLL